MWDEKSFEMASTIVFVIVLLTGLVGNSLTMYGLKKIEDMSCAARTFHAVVTGVDLVALTLSITRFGVLGASVKDVFTSPVAACKILPWLEFSALTIAPWVIVVMALQVYQGLKMNINAGRNVTKWKTRVFCLFVGGMSLIGNGHLMYFFGHPDEEEKTNSGTTVPPGNTTTDVFDEATRECAPMSSSYSTFYYQVWPWMSLCASLFIPVVTIVVVSVLTLRLLIVGSRQSDHVPLLASFRQLVISVLVLSLFTVVMSAPLTGVAFMDAGKYWTDYPATLMDEDSRLQGDQFRVWFIVRLVFYAQFALRWVLTCGCWHLWSKIPCCRRKSSTET